jgi:RHS repeat-associated protein
LPTTDVPQTSAGINASNNRLATTGVAYDNDGNATQIASQLMTYDAEDRQVTATGAGAAAQYVYDGEGRRVQKLLGGVATNYVYDAEGQLAAEYAPQPAASDCGTPICYFTEDHLGSTRLLTDQNGNVAKRFDYLPFGEEIFAGVGGRTATEGYLAAPDPLNPKFTGKIHDNETGLDFMEARYFSSAQGRFTIPDWSAKEEPVPYAKLENPQSLNLYTYVHDNPLSAFDPDGHGCTSGGMPNADTGTPCPDVNITVDNNKQRATITSTMHTTEIVKDNQGNIIGTKMTTTTNTAVISTAKDDHGALLGGTTQTSTKQFDMSGKLVNSNVGEEKSLTPLEAANAVGSQRISDARQLTAPTFMQKHWAGVGSAGTGVVGGGAAVACAIGEPCGAIAATIGGVAGIISGVLAGVEVWNNK